MAKSIQKYIVKSDDFIAGVFDSFEEANDAVEKISIVVDSITDKSKAIDSLYQERVKGEFELFTKYYPDVKIWWVKKNSKYDTEPHRWNPEADSLMIKELNEKWGLNIYDWYEKNGILNNFSKQEKWFWENYIEPYGCYIDGDSKKTRNVLDKFINHLVIVPFTSFPA